MVNDFEIDGSVQFADEITALCGLIMINHHGLYIFHIQAERITEEQNQKQGNNKGQVKAAEIPDQVVDIPCGRWPLRFSDSRRPPGHQLDESIV